MTDRPPAPACAVANKAIAKETGGKMKVRAFYCRISILRILHTARKWPESLWAAA